jgi:hypothetical protein
MKLFDLTSAYQNLLELAANGEDFEAALDELRGSIEEKAENYAFVIKALEAEEDSLDTLIKELQAKKQHKGNATTRLKDHLKAGMEAAGIEKVKGAIFTVALQNSPPSVEVDYELGVQDRWRTATLRMPSLQVTPELLDFVTDMAIDKKAVLEAHKAEEAIGPGLTVKQSKHLRIR